MGLELPEDLRAFYLIADGAESSGIFPSCESYDMAFSPLPLEEVVYGWKMHKELLETGNFPGKAESDPGIAPAWWHVGWIPFAGNGGGDFFCIDTVPTAGGTRGQVIAHSHESGKRVKLADSLSAYLSQIAGGLESNALKYDETYGLQAAAEDDDE
jgi:cell wall assembly regulator SMI1